MTSRTSFILIRRSYLPALLAYFQYLENIIRRSDIIRHTIKHLDPMPFEFSHYEISLKRAIVLRDQTVETLVIDLKVVYFYLEKSAHSFYLLVYLLENVENCSWDDAVEILNFLRNSFAARCDSIHHHFRTEHGEGLARTALSVSEKGPVEAFHELAD